MKRFLLLLPLLVLTLSGCDLSMHRPIMDEIRDSGMLRVVTRNAPTTYYQGRDRVEGFEHDLARLFAAHLGVKVVFIKKQSRSEILQTLEQGKAHLAAAGLVRREEDGARYLYGPDYQSVFQQVVCRRGGVRPNNLLKLTEANLTVVKGSAHEARLQELRELVPQLNWRSDEDLSVEQVLEQVWMGKVDCTLADSNVVALNRRYYPELTVKFPINAEQRLAWTLQRRAVFLHKEVVSWFNEIRSNGQLDELFEKYYGFVESQRFDFVDNRKYIKRISERLPRYKRLFMNAGRKYHVPWQLLAAQAYQESHWDPKARSPTGVRGIMMLTKVTAKALGIRDRLDPKSSINGGAWYLSNMRRRLPSAITEPDRTWIALAAYNVGLGHVYDARRLAKEQQLNPNRWSDLRNVLPLLSQRKYFKDLKYGYARGAEPVRYVAKVRHYHDILTRMDRKAVVQFPRVRAFVEPDTTLSSAKIKEQVLIGEINPMDGRMVGTSGKEAAVPAPRRRH
ncbi:membrane-bound lytic murein transglycosylase MltF [Magnetococcus sp. PR-3]|uniref:membrane-bound lytic murein transglycosylase MltF n=1 Tax=Magnetococcus sp. PR-3 TaxID=3120355 RepID=UPI002FCDF365